MQKSCSNCSESACFSLVAIISTVGVSGRVQKSSPVVLFCDDCLRELCERMCSEKLQEGVNSAYTSLRERLCERSTAQ
jgi:hypothetical protein